MHQTTSTDTDQLAALTRLIRIPADPSLLERMCDGDDDVRNATRPCGPLIKGGSPTVDLGVDPSGRSTDLVPEPVDPPARLRRCETVVCSDNTPSLYHHPGIDADQAAILDAELMAACCGEPPDSELANSLKERYAASEAETLAESVVAWRARRPENEAAYQAAAPVRARFLAAWASSADAIAARAEHDATADPVEPTSTARAAGQSDALAWLRSHEADERTADDAAAPVETSVTEPLDARGRCESVEPAVWPTSEEDSAATRPLETADLEKMYAAFEADGVAALEAWRAADPKNEAAYQAAAPLRAMFPTTDHTRALSTERPMYDCDTDLFADFPDLQTRRPLDAAASYVYERLDADADEWRAARAARAAESAPADQPPAKRCARVQDRAGFRAGLEEIRRRAEVAAALYAMEQACRHDVDVPSAPPTDSFSCEPPAWWAPWALITEDPVPVQRVGSVWRLNERRFLCFGPDTCDAETVADVRTFMLERFELIVVSPDALVDAHRKIKAKNNKKPTELSDDDWRASPTHPRESTDDWVGAISRSPHAAHATQAFRAVLLRTAVDDRLVADPAESSTPTDALYITVYNEAIEHAIEHLANRAAMIY